MLMLDENEQVILTLFFGLGEHHAILIIKPMSDRPKPNLNLYLILHPTVLLITHSDLPHFKRALLTCLPEYSQILGCQPAFIIKRTSLCRYWPTQIESDIPYCQDQILSCLYILHIAV